MTPRAPDEGLLPFLGQERLSRHLKAFAFHSQASVRSHGDLNGFVEALTTQKPAWLRRLLALRRPWAGLVGLSAGKGKSPRLFAPLRQSGHLWVGSTRRKAYASLLICYHEGLPQSEGCLRVHSYARSKTMAGCLYLCLLRPILPWILLKTAQEAVLAGQGKSASNTN
jgi:hypothetical protein